MLERLTDLLLQKLDRPRSVTHSLVIGMSGDPDDPRSGQARKVVVLELLGHVPRDQVAVGPLAARQSLHDALLRDLALQTNLLEKVQVIVTPHL